VTVSPIDLIIKKRNWRLSSPRRSAYKPLRVVGYQITWVALERRLADQQRGISRTRVSPVVHLWILFGFHDHHPSTLSIPRRVSWTSLIPDYSISSQWRGSSGGYGNSKTIDSFVDVTGTFLEPRNLVGLSLIFIDPDSPTSKTDCEALCDYSNRP
jgi:hypothetical protein